MRNTFTLLFFILVCSLFSFAREAQHPKGAFSFRIEGKINNGGSRKVYLRETVFWKDTKLLDTTITDEDGKFVFSETIAEPSHYELTVEGSMEAISFVVADTVVGMYADVSNLRNSLELTGSREAEVQAAFGALKERERAIYTRMDDWRSEMDNALRSHDSSAIVKLRKSGYDLESEIINLRKDVMLRYPGSLTSLMRLKTVQSPSRDLFLQDSILRVFESSSLRDHSLIGYFRNELDQMQRLQPGANAPEFSLPDLKGKQISLSSLNGKYVLIDFWASWCDPCRDENPRLVRTFKRFGGKQFTILSVSLDKNPDSWKRAVAADQMTWFNVCEVNGFASEIAKTYAITNLPTSILIDPQGKIVGRDLRGENLDMTLEKLLSIIY